MIRKDIKQIMKLEKEEGRGDKESGSSSSDDDDDWEASHDRKIEDKVMYGSDSDMDIDRVINQRPDYYEYYEEYDEEGEEEGEEDMDGPDDLEFDQDDEESKNHNISGLDDNDGTPRSDINNSYDYLNNSDTSSTHRSDTEEEEKTRGPTSIEMVDLKKKSEYVMKEF